MITPEEEMYDLQQEVTRLRVEVERFAEVVQAAEAFAYAPQADDTFLVTGGEVNRLRDALAALKGAP